MFRSKNELWKPFYPRHNYLHRPTFGTICSSLNVCTCVLSTQSNWNRIPWHPFLRFSDSWIIQNWKKQRLARYGSYLCYWRKIPGQTCAPIKFTALCYVTQRTVVYTHKPFGKRRYRHQLTPKRWYIFINLHDIPSRKDTVLKIISIRKQSRLRRQNKHERIILKLITKPWYCNCSSRAALL
jgi:hypothetical protein